MSYFKWNGNYKAIVSPNGESILMVYGRRIGGSERESTSLESWCVQLDEERDKYRGLSEKLLSNIDEMIYDMYGDNITMADAWKKRTDKFREALG
ncbi:hypothetical protein IH781_01060 [Patescibacteria group bacterium]|nr:hypothetical protein [Patescibacteria group bacterium]